jgi:hypothetical protein
VPDAGDTVHASDIIDRSGVRLRRASNQSINNAALTAISWDTEDEDIGGFWASGTTVTVPAGYDGIYVATFRPLGVTGVSTRNFAEINITSTITGLPAEYRIPSSSPTSPESRMVAYYSGPLAAGDSFVCNVFQTTAGSQTFTAWLALYRVGD